MHKNTSSRCAPAARSAEKAWVEIMLNDRTTPYFLGTVIWVLAWWLQMGPYRHLFNFAPGVELPFFPAGVRTLAVFAFGFPGAVGIFIGSLVTYSLYFPELLNASPVAVIGCAAASAFSSYIAMRLVCGFYKIPNSLEGLTLKNVGWIVVTQGLLSASLHQFLYHAEIISSSYKQESLNTMLLNWGAMVTGDALGSMAVIFAVLIGYQLYYRNRSLQR